MQDAEYQEMLKKQSYEDLLAIRKSLNRTAYPERYALVIAEIDGRDKLTIPPPLPGSKLDATWRSSSVAPEVDPLTKALLLIGFLLQVASLFMRYAETQTVLTARPFVALVGAVVFLVGCARIATIRGRSRWFGVFGLLGIIGLAILCALPKKSGSKPLLKQT